MLTGSRSLRAILSLLLVCPVPGCTDRSQGLVGPVGDAVVQVAVRATGVLPDTSVSLIVDGELRATVAPWREREVLVRVPPGEHTLELKGVDDNCALPGQAVRNEVPAGATVRVEFILHCVAAGPIAGLEFLVTRSSGVWLTDRGMFRFLANGNSAAWTPDGQQVAVAEGWGSIYMVPAADAGPRRVLVPDDGWWVADPAWSPGGARLAYFWCGDATDIFGEDCVQQVRLARLTTEGWVSRVVADDRWTPAWAPDGSLLAAAGYRTVDFYSSDGVWQRSISPSVDPIQTYAPAFSPDGSRLAYLVWPRGGSSQGLWIRDLVTGSEREIRTPWANGIWRVDWLPGEAGLIVGGHVPDANTVCLFWISLDGTGMRPLLPCGEPTWSFGLRPHSTVSMTSLAPSSWRAASP